jgi:23S rRNA (cytosine1962-C5)-methyltransferase
MFEEHAGGTPIIGQGDVVIGHGGDLTGPRNSQIVLAFQYITGRRKTDILAFQQDFQLFLGQLRQRLGELPEETFALENSLKYRLNFLNNQNIGFFPDMKIGREFVRDNAQGKKVLNLFAYTCPFSVAAIAGGAKSVVNVDMSKGALSTGRENHRLNALDPRSSQYMPYNILNSWSRIRKAGPYDLIIIDPPSFQKGSFAATSDYAKIIRRLKELAADSCTVLSALNAPELGTEFIRTLFKENAPEFAFVGRLENMESFPSDDDERSLKNLIFQKGEA